MNRYVFTIEERLSRDVGIVANSLEQAMQLLRDEYRRSEIVLDAGDFKGAQMRCILPEQTEWTDID